MRLRRHPLGLALLACASLALSACGGGAGEAETTSITIPAGADQTVPGGGADAVEEAGGGESAAEAERTAERYVNAIDDRDAAEVCSLLAPGALDEVRGVSGPCEPALDAAFGTRPTNGGPAWKGTEVQHPTVVKVAGDSGRVTLEVLHRFSDRDNPSIEDDVIYLRRDRERWLVTQASATLYRAVGYPEPPLRAFAPPG